MNGGFCMEGLSLPEFESKIREFLEEYNKELKLIHRAPSIEAYWINPSPSWEEPTDGDYVILIEYASTNMCGIIRVTDNTGNTCCVVDDSYRRRLAWEYFEPLFEGLKERVSISRELSVCRFFPIPNSDSKYLRLKCFFCTEDGSNEVKDFQKMVLEKEDPDTLVLNSYYFNLKIDEMNEIK